jgi:hypothetical protein
MSYPSVDQLQKILTRDVFHYAKDRKKAAGRALGTLVEVITFYTLKSWGLGPFAIERPLPEYRNPEIAHNIEYSLHPSSKIAVITFTADDIPITTPKIIRGMAEHAEKLRGLRARSNQLLSTSGVLRNACTIGDVAGGFIVADLQGVQEDKFSVNVCLLRPNPFAIVECKRVGVEEGTKKGASNYRKSETRRLCGQDNLRASKNPAERRQDRRYHPTGWRRSVQR